MKSDALFMNFGPQIELEESEPKPHAEELDNVLSRYLGPFYNDQLSRDELGLTSNASIPMRRDVESAFPLSLPAGCLDRYPTPASLKENNIFNDLGTSLL